MRALVWAIGALVIVAGCGRLPGAQNSTGDYKLYEAASTSSSQQVSVIDSRSHSVERTLPLGTPSPDWSHLYSVQGDNLVDLDPQTGTVLNQIRLPGAYQLPPATMSGVPGGLSPDGRWLVLESFDQTSNSMVSATHLVVVDTSYAQKPKRIDLTGYYQFDAVNNEGTRVYLIEYVSDSQYYVRFFNVGSSTLDPTIVFDKSDGSAAMAGTRLSGVASRDGQWLYSVYVRPDKSAFIHALSLESPIAFCIDLPGSGYSTNPDEFHWSLALNAAGTNLYAANGATGVVAEIFIDANGFPSTNRAIHLATGQTSSIFAQDVQAKELGGNAAAVSPDGRTLVIAGKTGLLWIDTVSMTDRARQLADWRVWSLGMSPDGSTVYAVNDAGMIAELPMTGAHSPTTFGGAAGQPLALIRVAAA
jgi:DNA-binding beta-propeller fold protein YncE